MAARRSPDDANAPGVVGPFGDYIRTQRQLARLTLRQLAQLTSISNPYLSQLERGMHQPSITVVKSLADALGLSAEALLSYAAGLDDDGGHPPDADAEAAIRADTRLTSSQRAALLSVFHTMIADSTGTSAAATRSGTTSKGTSARREGAPSTNESDPS